MKSILLKMGKVTILSLAIMTMFCTCAKAFGVTLVSKTVPQSAMKGINKNFKLQLCYDTEVYGIPTPELGRIGAEIPYNFKKPVYKSGSFESMTFIDKTGLSTGTTVWQCYKTFGLFGTETKSFNAVAKANAKGSKRGYVGVGDSFGWTGYDYYFSTNIKG